MGRGLEESINQGHQRRGADHLIERDHQRGFPAGGNQLYFFIEGVGLSEEVTPLVQQQAPFPRPATPCPAVAITIAPGQTRTETLPAGGQQGVYRAVVRYQPRPFVGDGVAYSEPYAVAR